MPTNNETPPDIVDRKSANEKFRGLLEAAPDATVIVTEDGRIAEVNGQIEHLFGYGPDELVGEAIERLIPERYRAQHRRVRDAFSMDPLRRPMGARANLFGLRKNGTEFPVEISLNPLETEEGRVVIAAVRDVTDRKEMQARLALSDRLASIGTLAAGIAHEINNPLGFVVNNLELVAEELRDVAGSSPSGRLRTMMELVGDAREGAERIRKIVRGMRVFSRADEERRELLEIPRVLDVAVNMALTEVRHRARLVKDYQPVARVLAEESRFVQVFVNLLVNAAQAIPEGQAEENEIVLSTKTEGAHAVIEVRDSGRGIPLEVIGRIFDPFFTTKPVGVGVGLGLSICHRIIASLGGEITVRSQVNAGTTFRIELPVAPVDSAPDQFLAPGSQPSQPSRRGRVLIVDDDPLVRAALGRVLRDHDVSLARGGREALDLLASGLHFDVILCDLMMPEMTGVDLHTEVGRRFPGVSDQMVFMSGGAFTAAARDFLDRVPNHRLEKPCDAQALRAVVNGLLR
ncbi:MAG: ATP-binding protein [Polyangiaceae bacterium]|jgi:PAS domain S-box-containing protein